MLGKQVHTVFMFSVIKMPKYCFSCKIVLSLLSRLLKNDFKIVFLVCHYLNSTALVQLLVRIECCALIYAFDSMLLVQKTIPLISTHQNGSNGKFVCLCTYVVVGFII